MIVNPKIKITADPRGKITSGRRNPATGQPEKLPYFNISKFPELVNAYGEKPTALLLFFPTNRIIDFYNNAYVRWGKSKDRGQGSAGTKVRQCNGESCVHRIDEEVEGRQYVAGEETPCICKALPEDHKKRCRYECWFKAFIALPQTGKVDNPLCYSFHTTSENSGAAVQTELEKILVLHGQLTGVPFVLSVQMGSKASDAKSTFPIWTLRPVGMLSNIRQLKPFEADTSAVRPLLVEASAEVDATPRPLEGDRLVLELTAMCEEANSREALTTLYKQAQAALGSKALTQKQFAIVEQRIREKAQRFPRGGAK